MLETIGVCHVKIGQSQLAQVVTVYVPGAGLWPSQGQNHRRWALQGRPQSLCVHCPRQSLPVLIASAPLIAPCKSFVTLAYEK